MRFLLSGYYGFNNVGDEAVLAAIITNLQHHYPAAQICVLSADPEATRTLHQVDAIQRWSIREVWKALGRADMLLQGGGGLYQDSTSRISPVYYMGILRMARLRKVPAVCLAQGFGPLNTPVLRRLVANEYRHLKAITLREPQAISQLKELGVISPTPVLVGDPALLLAPRLEQCTQDIKALCLDPTVPRILLTIRQWPETDNAISACRSILEHYTSQGWQGIVAAFQQPDDKIPARLIAAGIPNCTVLPTTAATHPAILAGHVASSQLVVSMRLHGLIFAAAQAVPAVGISYDPKVQAFCELAKRPWVDAKKCTGSELINAAEEQLARKPGELEKTAEELKASAELSFNLIDDMVNQL